MFRYINHNTQRVFYRVLFSQFVDNVYFMRYYCFRKEVNILDFGKYGNCLEGRLYAIRKDKKLSQEEFGNRIGISRSAICNYESRIRPVSNQVILAVCREFNIDELWMRNGVGNPYKPKKDGVIEQLIQEYKCTKFEGDFLKTYFQMDENERIKFVECIYRLFAPLMKGLKGFHPFADYFIETYGTDFCKIQEIPTIPETLNEPNQEEKSTEELEEKYKKSRSDSVPKTTLSASGIIEENVKKKDA